MIFLSDIYSVASFKKDRNNSWKQRQQQQALVYLSTKYTEQQNERHQNKMSNKRQKSVEVNVGPQVNCGDAVESIEINDSTKLICNCSKVSRTT